MNFFISIIFAVFIFGQTVLAAETTQAVPVWKKPFQEHKIADSKWSIKPGLESRHRFEYRDDFNFRDATYEDAQINLIRNRLNLDLSRKDKGSHLPLVRIYAEGYDAQSFSSSAAFETSSFENDLDLMQLFGEVELGENQNFGLKVGRQELSFGDERLVGAPKWGNTLRVFDAVKGRIKFCEMFSIDAFASRVVRIEKESPDGANSNDNFFGLYGNGKPFKDHQFDTFFYIRNLSDDSLVSERPGIRGPLKEYTVGNLFKGKKWGWNYASEYAVQFGRRAHDSIMAWAFHQDLGYQFEKVLWTPKIYGEFNHASGDRDTSDGKFETFDQLYPGNHSKYGLMDLTGFKNMNHFTLGTSIKPYSKVTLASDFHWYFLDARETAWFADNGAVVKAANPNASRQLGEELDLTVSYKWIPELETLVGYSHFFSGPFIQDTGSNDDANFFYVQTTFKI